MTWRESFVYIVTLVSSLDTAGIRNNNSDLVETIEFGVGGDSDTVLNLETGNTNRVRDYVWEGMVKTAWLDYITRLNRDKELYGLQIEPLKLSHVLEDELYISQTMLGYQVELWMWNLTLHGLSGLKLEKLSLER